MYRFLFQNLKETATQKSMRDTHIRKSNTNTTLKIVIEPKQRTKE